jgi:hypothetical protein
LSRHSSRAASMATPYLKRKLGPVFAGMKQEFWMLC